MSSNNRHYIILLLWAVLTACNAVATQQSTVKRDFEARKEALNLPGYYTIFDRQLDDDRREALEFLYAYMPLPDLTDYTGDFYLENVDCSLRARKEMPWGASVPDREWRHFVLPVRVNNENLDSSRMVFYNELRDRVKGLSMRDAVLEVNHWCHEKVTYQPSDSRTSSPLASIKSAYGRCGEESTFTVAALRAVGIPARQVYTPRWAHTDDNHAWVEAWVDGRWYFLGACEPEAVLNLGWFNAPASRGMLMNTKTFGRYDGPEQQLAQSPCYTEINVTANYAPVDSVMVTVVDSDGNQAAGARVDYKLYNYAEFYSIASRRADEKGKSTLTTGRGDLLVWATDGESFGFKKCTVGKDREIVVTLDHRMPVNEAIELDIVPPVQAVALPEVTPEQARENDRRKAQEDSLRGAYMATFFTP
ncbi:transglutaminase domain-containing protein, partial [uncultured Muribaculum sp.]